jgi:hypothetical protein
MAREEIKPAVENIVNREVKWIKGAKASSLEVSAVGRAGYRAAAAAEAIVGQDLTLGGIAEMLGVPQKAEFADASFRGAYVHERVSAEDRDRYGYDDLPDALITDVTQAILKGLTQYDSPEPARLLATRMMLAVRARPDITPYQLRSHLAEVNADGALNTVARGMSPHTLVAMQGVVTIAHDLSAKYFNAHSAEAGIPVRVVASSEAVAV